jgi:hypothetical protein
MFGPGCFVRGFGTLVALCLSFFMVSAAAPAVAAEDPEKMTVRERNALCDTGGVGKVGESKTNPRPYDPSTIDVEIGQAKLSHQSSPNHITMEIRVLNKNKAPTCAAYPVYLQFYQPPGEPEDAPGCADVSFNDPEVPRGTYHCTAIINGPGKWTFIGTVNKPADIRGGEIFAVQTPIKTAEVTIDFPDVPQLAGGYKGLKYVVEGSTFEVFLLQLHLATAALWILLALMMAFLAVPRLRQTLSVLAVHTLEVRRGALVSLLWASFAATLGTGLYLLGTQTAYDAPFSAKNFSFSDWDKITKLPYAQSYFLVLYGKILVFGLMAAASVLLMMEAGRRAQLAQDAESLDRDDDDDMWSKGVHFDEEGHVIHEEDLAVAGGATASVTRTAVRAQRRTHDMAGLSQRTMTICVVVLIAGTLAIGGAVTGLKYLHELIETASAAAIIATGG